MSKQKESSTQNPELKKMLDFIENRLNFKPNEDKTMFTKEVNEPGTRVIINGQRSVQPGAKHTMTIKYVGEGSMCQESNKDSAIPLWGFEIDQDDQPASPTEYVDSFEQFVDMFR